MKSRILAATLLIILSAFVMPTTDNRPVRDVMPALNPGGVYNVEWVQYFVSFCGTASVEKKVITFKYPDGTWGVGTVGDDIGDTFWEMTFYNWENQLISPELHVGYTNKLGITEGWISWKQSNHAGIDQVHQECTMAYYGLLVIFVQ